MTGSEAVVQAMRFLRQVHRDVAAMLESVDADLTSRGWERAMRGQKISTDLSNGTSPDGWALNYATRTYSPKASPDAAGAGPKRVVAFMVSLHPDHHDQAIALTVGASVRTTLTGDALWYAWKDARPLLAYLREHPVGGPLPPKVLREGFLADAVEGSAFMTSLMELADMETVRKRLLEPALKAAG
jgi:hypothetical protein